VSTPHLDEELLDLALGHVGEEARARMEAHAAGCPRCAAGLTATIESLGAFAATTPAVAPPRAVRDRLFASIAGGGRLERFAVHVARLIDVSLEKARALLDGIDDPASWVAGPAPGVMLYHLEAGPAVAGAGVGFIRLRAGQPFPHHEHLGVETTFVVQGGFRENDGTVQQVGTEDVDAPGTSHSFVALPGPDLIYLTVLRVGVDMEGVGKILVGDPRL